MTIGEVVLHSTPDAPDSYASEGDAPAHYIRLQHLRVRNSLNAPFKLHSRRIPPTLSHRRTS
jgi:hypothetical protein